MIFAVGPVNLFVCTATFKSGFGIVLNMMEFPEPKP
jgi:hypothetical protein